MTVDSASYELDAGLVSVLIKTDCDRDACMFVFDLLSLDPTVRTAKPLQSHSFLIKAFPASA